LRHRLSFRLGARRFRLFLFVVAREVEALLALEGQLGFVRRRFDGRLLRLAGGIGVRRLLVNADQLHLFAGGDRRGLAPVGGGRVRDRFAGEILVLVFFRARLGGLRCFERAFLADRDSAAAEGGKLLLGVRRLGDLGFAAVATIAGSLAPARTLQTIEHAEVGPSRGLVVRYCRRIHPGHRNRCFHDDLHGKIGRD
jgi:hypothetical protein